MQDQLLKIAERVFNLEVECGVIVDTNSYQEKLKFSVADVVYYWAQGKDFKTVSEMTIIKEGSIVRAITRIEYVCRELKNAAAIMGDGKLKDLIELSQERIKRDIIFTPSLYIQ